MHAETSAARTIKPMKNTIEKTMNELRTDHRNMVQLLDLLDAETVRLADCDEPDYDLVYDIMTYMSEYPDAVHHPKEDMIYRHLKSIHPDIDESLKHIEDDHKALGEASHEIRRDIDAIAADGVVSRESLAQSLQKYSEDLRKHMYWEEKELFELADALDDDENWTELLKVYDEASDPLFGNQTERRFQKLLNGIQRRIVWDSQQYFV
jgi:hemerythrin-like domain-containing protein